MIERNYTFRWVFKNLLNLINDECLDNTHAPIIYYLLIGGIIYTLLVLFIQYHQV